MQKVTGDIGTATAGTSTYPANVAGDLGTATAGTATLARLMAANIIEHVRNGGWLGASWPHYVAGFNGASQAEVDAAMAAAEEAWPEIWIACRDNFAEQCEDQENQN